MRITLHTLGGLDEVLPLAGLGKALQQHGHSVLLCVPEKFRSRIMKVELRMISCGASFEDLLEEKPNPSDFLQRLTSEVPVHFVSLRDALREADLLVGGLLPLAAPSMAEQLSLPYLQMITSPTLLDRSKFPAPGIPVRNSFFAGLERRKWEKQWKDHLMPAINRERSFSGLPPVRHLYDYLFQSGFRLIAVDPEFVSGEKFENSQLTGFWFEEEEIQLDADWQDFLGSSDPIAFVGPVENSSELSVSLLSAGFRVLFSDDSSERMTANSRSRTIPGDNQIPAGIAVAIHKGLSRFIAEAARNGIPQIIAPQFLYQNDWAKRVERLGIGIVTSNEVAAITETAKRLTSDRTFAQRAANVSEIVRKRNAYAPAIAAIEKIANS